MAILLPVALHLPPTGAIIIMAGIYYGAMYGGSTTAILMNIPGEVASVITAQDGFAMTKQGRAGEALAIAAIGSYLAGILGTLAIAVMGPKVADLALHFGPPEYFGLVLFSMTALVSFAGRSILVGLMLGVFGMWLASIGTDPLTGTQRLNFGTHRADEGVRHRAGADRPLRHRRGAGEPGAEDRADLRGQARLGAVDDPARGRARARAGGVGARHGDRLRSGAASGHAAGADGLPLLRRRAADLAHA